MAADLKGKVQTVLGPIDPTQLGRTLTHEHLMIDASPLGANVPCPPFLLNMNSLPFTMENLGFIRQFPWSYKPNLTLYGEEQHVIEELKFFKQHGGSSMVECTIVGLERDMNMMKRMAEESGVNIISGTGYYVDSALPSEVHSATQEQLVSTMVHDITQGAAGTDIRCGVIGEIGTSWPVTATEKKVLQATAAAQTQLGCPVIIHPGRNKQAPAEVIRILAEAGGDISRTVMSHLDRTICDHEDLSAFAKLGCYLELDLFGIEVSYYQLGDFDMPSDAQRIKMIKHVLDEGYEDRVVIAHDLYTKHRLMHYGGHGYSHILLNVVPMMLARGISQDQVDKMLIHNPSNWLTFKFLGCIDPSQLGRTLTHEHLWIDASPLGASVPSFPPNMDTLPFTMENLGFIRQFPYSHTDNLTLHGEEQHVAEELNFFKQHGGSSVVECTTVGIKNNIGMLKTMAEKTGVNIIAGAGYYVDSSLPSEVHSATQEQLVSTMVHDITQGAAGTDIRCGVIGEIGTSWPITATEKKVLQATAAAQTQLGCPVIIHPGRNKQAPAEVIRILAEAGGDISRTVMSHLDRSIYDKGELSEFAKLGSYMEWDLFGIEVSYYQQVTDLDMPSDAQRIQMVKHVLDNGYEDRVVIAHDIHTKHRLMHYGGHGYSHILLNVVPMMLARGISQDQVDKMLIHNPSNWLTFK